MHKYFVSCLEYRKHKQLIDKGYNFSITEYTLDSEGMPVRVRILGWYPSAESVRIAMLGIRKLYPCVDDYTYRH